MKIAVVFPGIGYHVDKPLLYYSKKIAVAHGYEIKDVPYGNFPSGVKGNKGKMNACFTGALDQCEDILRDVDFSHYTDILFLSKSIGTAIASAYGQKHGLKTKNVYFTPVGESFQYMDQPGIVFHGTADGWVDTETVITECKARNLPLHIIENANHSLETGDWAVDIMSESEKNMLACSASGEMQSWYHDLRNLENIMVSVEKYIAVEGEPTCFS